MAPSRFRPSAALSRSIEAEVGSTVSRIHDSCSDVANQNLDVDIVTEAHKFDVHDSFADIPFPAATAPVACVSCRVTCNRVISKVGHDGAETLGILHRRQKWMLLTNESLSSASATSVHVCMMDLWCNDYERRHLRSCDRQTQQYLDVIPAARLPLVMLSLRGLFYLSSEL